MQEDWTCCKGEVKHGDKNDGNLVRYMALSQRPDKDLQAGNQKAQGVVLSLVN